MSAKGRVSFYLPSLRGGGAERVTVAIANGLLSRGYKVDIVLSEMVGPCINLLSSDVRLIDLKSKRVSTSIPALMRYFRNESPDALMSSMWHANIAAVLACKISGAKSRIVVREASTPSQYLRKMSFCHEFIYTKLMRMFYHMANSVVSPSMGVAEDLFRHVGVRREQMTVIGNPVIRDDLFKKADEKINHPWFSEESPPVFLSIGRLEYAKDQASLIKAFAKLRAFKVARLMIIGEGSERAKLEMLVKELDLLGDVALPGFIDNPYPYLKQSAVYVLSSRWEGLPNVLIEALALGCRIVATDCQNGPREILVNGKYGELVQVGDIEQLFSAMMHAVDKSKIDFPKEILSQFEQNSVLDSYECLLFGRADKVNHQN